MSVAPEKYQPVSTNAVPVAAQYLWDKDPDVDDALHDPRRDALLDGFTPFSLRGWTNIGMIVILIGCLIGLFIGYPVAYYYTHLPAQIIGYNIGGINGSGQVPDLEGLPRPIDRHTPQSAYTRTGSDNQKYDLVFSDEFNVPGRTFYPGDDPYWEAVDLHYWCAVFITWKCPY